MKEKTLLKIAIGCALIGVFVLYIISDSVKIDETSIGKIEEEDIGSDVKVKGRVERLYEGEKVSIITIIQPEDMSIIVMKQDNKNLSLEEGDYIEVIGEVDEYNGELEVIGNRIRVLS
ncbi:MAG: OB-fold nucleic acid binding domain-containing protein [Nanoarchaeota archaeon]|nr:OB-fold nucleic acid binding domain-containing protein [Nanoarchaeota archaeon]